MTDRVLAQLPAKLTALRQVKYDPSTDQIDPLPSIDEAEEIAALEAAPSFGGWVRVVESVVGWHPYNHLLCVQATDEADLGHVYYLARFELVGEVIDLTEYTTAQPGQLWQYEAGSRGATALVCYAVSEDPEPNEDEDDRPHSVKMVEALETHARQVLVDYETAFRNVRAAAAEGYGPNSLTMKERRTALADMTGLVYGLRHALDLARHLRTVETMPDDDDVPF